jgi:hypothetical protein
MIALFLAAQLSAEALRDLPMDRVVDAPAHSFVMRVYAPTRRCQGAGRFQTSAPAGAEPALLLRPQDRIAPRKLKDMPPATACLTANPGEVAR